jgi:hypothetical protein
MKEQIKTLAVKVFGMTDDEAQSLFKKTDEGETLNESFIDILSKKDRERLDRLQENFKPQLSEMHDKGYKKAQKEVLSKAEKEIKEKYGYETDKPLVELVDDLVSLNSKKGGVEDIKTHPDYIKLERSLQSEFIPKSKYEELAGEFEGYKNNIHREKTIGKVKEDARSLFRQLNPILSKDPKKASYQENEFLSKLESFDYQLQDDGNHVILKEGKRLENQNLNPIAFNEFVKEKAAMLFDFAEQPVRGNSGVDTSGTTNALVFKDESDFMARYRSEADMDKRVAMYKAAQKQGIV